MAERLLQDRPLGRLNASIKPTDGELPPNLAAIRLSDAGVFFDAIDDIRPWMVINDVQWDAPATRHLPLFFEEPNLERLGYTHRCYLDICGYETDPILAELMQPFISGTHFVACIACAPYTCGVRSPCEPVYTLGTDRPGSPVLYRKYFPPVSLRGAIFEAAVVCGLVFGVP